MTLVNNFFTLSIILFVCCSCSNKQQNKPINETVLISTLNDEGVKLIDKKVITEVDTIRCNRMLFSLFDEKSCYEYFKIKKELKTKGDYDKIGDDFMLHLYYFFDKKRSCDLTIEKYSFDGLNDAKYFYSFLKEISYQVEFVDTFSHQQLMFFKSEKEVFVLYNHCPDNKLDANNFFSDIGIDEPLYFEMSNW